jgi:ABC-2 type transport system ATP-binding protein
MGRAAARRRADELLDRFDLREAAGRPAVQWSGGMRRRLVLWDVVSGLVADGTTVLLTTQYLDEADRLADEVAVIDSGAVVARGAPAKLKSEVAGTRLELELVDDAAFAAVRTFLGGRVVAADPATRTLAVGTDPAAAAVRCLLDEVDPRGRLVARFAVRAATLDDVFLALTAPAKEPSHV